MWFSYGYMLLLNVREFKHKKIIKIGKRLWRTIGEEGIQPPCPRPAYKKIWAFPSPFTILAFPQNNYLAVLGTHLLSDGLRHIVTKWLAQSYIRANHNTFCHYIIQKTSNISASVGDSNPDPWHESDILPIWPCILCQQKFGKIRLIFSCCCLAFQPPFTYQPIVIAFSMLLQTLWIQNRLLPRADRCPLFLK